VSNQSTGFSDLVLRYERGVDYELTVRDRNAGATILALHGGTIEPLTAELAELVAGDDWNLYAIRGLRAGTGAELRLPTLRLREFRCDALLDRSELALALDGCDAGDAALVGGRSERLVQALLDHLQAAGLPASETNKPEVERLALQCYNRAKHGGAQLSLPQELRRNLVVKDLDALTPGGGLPLSAVGETFVAAVRLALAESVRSLSTDLTITLERFERATRAARDAGWPVHGHTASCDAGQR